MAVRTLSTKLYTSFYRFGSSNSCMLFVLFSRGISYCQMDNWRSAWSNPDFKNKKEENNFLINYVQYFIIICIFAIV